MDRVVGVEFAQRIDGFGTEGAEPVGQQVREAFTLAWGDGDHAVLRGFTAEEFGELIEAMLGVAD